MIASSAINDPTDYAPGFLGRYLAVMARDVAPFSFHLLSGLFALSCFVGRRAALVRSAGTLYPPTSILLLGPSGIGKGLALNKALLLLKRATTDRPAFYLGEGNFTVRGVIVEWQRLQRQSPGLLEGAHIEDEISNILTEKTGTEGIIPWLIRALAQTDLIDLTREHGRSVVVGVTVGFGLGSTLSYLRRAVSVDAFTGGLMHRFLIAHDELQREPETESPPEPAELDDLVRELRAIRDGAPDALRVGVAAETRLRLLRRQASLRHYDSQHLAGFWNRYPTLVAKLAVLFALCEHKSEIEIAHLDRAVSLLEAKLYPVLDGVVLQLAASRDKKKLLDIGDDLRAAGPEGWSLGELYKRLDCVNPRQQIDMLQALLEQGLAWQNGSQVFGSVKWR